MKILFDHQAFTIQRYGGISRYFSELMKHFTIQSDLDFELALKFSDNIYLTDTYNKGLKINLPRFKGKSILLSSLNKYFSIKKIKKGRYDLFHPTYYNPYFLEYLNGHKFVLTVHDMTHELFPQSVHPMDRSAYYKKIAAEKAFRIICVSENTRRDLCRILKINEGKTEVVYHGSSLIKSTENQGIELPSKYILYVGTRGYYKNFDNLFAAVQPLIQADKDLFLLCAGGGRFNAKEIKKFTSSGVEEKVIYKDASDQFLPYLYSKAKVFVFPSFYEGFGIPILEAFSCNCPVISSNTSSLPEVAGDAAYYIDPHDISMIKEAVSKFIYDPALCEIYIEKGRERRELFSWTKTASDTIRVYNSV